MQPVQDSYEDFINALSEKARTLHMKERRISLESMMVVVELSERKAWLTLDMSIEKFAKHIGLTEPMYHLRSKAGKVIRDYPRALELYNSGELCMSQLALIAPRITEANQSLIFEGAAGKSKRETEIFLSRVTADGRLKDREGFLEITVRFTESQVQIIDRAREVLAHGGKVPSYVEIILKAALDLLEKRDPLKKAERAEKRENAKAKTRPEPVQVEVPEEAVKCENKREPIPGKVKNEVWLRDGGSCTYIHGDGKRCGSRMMIELDHIIMVCRGGKNTVENLRLRCRYHNQYEAEQMLEAHAYRERLRGRAWSS